MKESPVIIIVVCADLTTLYILDKGLLLLFHQSNLSKLAVSTTGTLLPISSPRHRPLSTSSLNTPTLSGLLTITDALVLTVADWPLSTCGSLLVVILL